MADKKISELTELTTPDGTEELVVNDSGTSKKITQTNLLSTALPKAGGTMTGDTLHGDNVKAKFGAGNDLQIWHDGGNSRISDVGTGNLIIRGSAGTYIQGVNGENGVVVLENGAVTLFHNNATKLATTSTGVNVTGSVTADGLTSDGATNYPIKWTGAGGAATGSLYGDGSSVGLFYGDSSFATGLNFTTDTLKFRTGSSERLRIDSDGLKFNGDTAAANALDDYEEGDFTPTLISGGDATLSTSLAKYTKIGNRVFITIYVSLVKNSSTSVLEMSGLPFTNIGNSWGSGLVNTSSALNIGARAKSSTATMDFKNPAGDGSTYINNFASSAHLVFQLQYPTA